VCVCGWLGFLLVCYVVVGERMCELCMVVNLKWKLMGMMGQWLSVMGSCWKWLLGNWMCLVVVY
jgi:hypothetical protein